MNNTTITTASINCIRDEMNYIIANINSYRMMSITGDHNIESARIYLTSQINNVKNKINSFIASAIASNSDSSVISELENMLFRLIDASSGI